MRKALVTFRLSLAMVACVGLAAVVAACSGSAPATSTAFCEAFYTHVAQLSGKEVVARRSEPGLQDSPLSYYLRFIGSRTDRSTLMHALDRNSPAELRASTGRLAQAAGRVGHLTGGPELQTDLKRVNAYLNANCPVNSFEANQLLVRGATR